MSLVTESWLTQDIRNEITSYIARRAYSKTIWFRSSYVTKSHGHRSRIARGLIYELSKRSVLIINGYKVTEYTKSKTYPKVFKLERMW